MLNEYSFGDIYIRHAIDDEPDEKSFTMHIHDKCEIYFFLSGDVEYLVEGSKYPLDENSLMIIRPAEAHTPKINGKGTYERYAVNFPIDLVKSIDPELRLLTAFTARELGNDNMFSETEFDAKLVNKLFSEMCSDNDDYTKRLAINTHLITLLDIINRAWNDKKKPKHKKHSTTERIVMYVNEHLTENISVSALAEHFYLSTSQFNRIFRQATGAAPWEYITKKRLTIAKDMLKNGTSAQETADSCGFKDYSVFYRAYIKQFGKAPKRNQAKHSFFH